MTTQEGAPIWLELGTFDLATSLEFYSGLFGWTADPPEPEFGDYRTVKLDGKRVAGFNPGVAADGWRVFLNATDAAATASRVEAAGGTIGLAPEQLGDLGVQAEFTDAGGAWVAAWQPGAHTGIEAEGVPGAPCWYELHALDFAADVAFYQQVFGWTVESIGDSDEFRMVTFPAGGAEGAVAGIYDATNDPFSTVSHWEVYFAVTDADTAAARIAELGGIVLSGPDDTPYGRMARAVDPMAVQFSIMVPA